SSLPGWRCSSTRMGARGRRSPPRESRLWSWHADQESGTASQVRRAPGGGQDLSRGLRTLEPWRRVQEASRAREAEGEIQDQAHLEGDAPIVLRSGGEIVGSIGFAPCLMPFGQLPSFEPTTTFTSEIGLFWALFPEHWRKGYATEAAAAMVSYAFSQLRLRRIVATTENDNARSIGVMRRLGMRLE